MPSNAPSDASDDMIAGVVLAIALIGSVVYLVVMFIAGVVGLIEQIAAPTTHIEFNRGVIVMTALPLFLFAYLTTPELRDDRTRLKVTLAAALAGMVVCALATAALAHGIDRPSSFEFAAAAYLLFAACGLLPVLAVARGYVFFDRDAQVAAAGDHYIDTSQLSPETKRLLALHTNATLKAPPGWRPPALFGAKDALTHADLRRILALEEEDERHLRDLFNSQAANANKAREDAHHAFILSLSPQEKALFEAKLKADVEAINGLTAYKAQIAAEVARLTDENQKLHAAVKAARQVGQALESAQARVAAQNKELATLKNTISELRASAAQRDVLQRSLPASERRRDELEQELERLRDENAWVKAHHLPVDDPEPTGKQTITARRGTAAPQHSSRRQAATNTSPHGGVR